MIERDFDNGIMPDSVPARCYKCPIRKWAEFFATLSREGEIIADSLHEVLGEDCPGATEEAEVGHFTKSVCQQPDVVIGDFGGIIKAHFDEAGIIMSAQLLTTIAEQES